MSIVAEAPGFLQVFSDGSVKRFAPEIAPASSQSHIGYKSKDIIINPTNPITARLFLPDHHRHSTDKLPVLVYFHGGGFCIGSTTWLGYHHFLGDLSVESRSIVLSVDYRLAPENRLPVAYDDCYASLEWLYQMSTTSDDEPWLRQFADLSRVFLSGDSAGGNIAHNVAVKEIRKRVWSAFFNIKGLLLIHPYFGSEKRTKKEMGDMENGVDVKSNDMFWRLSIPRGSNRDYFGCNFEMQDVCEDEWCEFPEVVVYVAELDFLKERGVMYAEFLKQKKVKRVEVIEAENQSHVFHVFDPKSEPSILLQRQMTQFMKSCY